MGREREAREREKESETETVPPFNVKGKKAGKHKVLKIETRSSLTQYIFVSFTIRRVQFRSEQEKFLRSAISWTSFIER